MNTTTPAFALTVRPNWFNLSDRAADKHFHWITVRAGFELSMNKTKQSCPTELEAWQAAVALYPNVLDELANSAGVGTRAYGLRGEMMLSVGPTRFAEMEEVVHAEILDIYERAMHVLDATKVTKAAPKVLRVAHSNSVSWLEVRSKIVTPYERTPTLCGIRCLPSPHEEKTWSVRIRAAMTSAAAVAEVQRRFDELVIQLGYQGITVKDVQNGTCIDL